MLRVILTGLQDYQDEMDRNISVLILSILLILSESYSEQQSSAADRPLPRIAPLRGAATGLRIHFLNLPFPNITFFPPVTKKRPGGKRRQAVDVTD